MSRLASLKARLAELRYNQPLGLESAPLVERLLDDLVQSQHQQAELASLTDKRGDELGVAEQHVLPVRKENTRLVRENNELHMQLIADAEAAAKARDELSAANTKLLSQNADLRFIASQQQSRLDSLQSENENLRSRFHEALEQNGIVLPSGVRACADASSPSPRWPCLHTPLSERVVGLCVCVRARWVGPQHEVRWHGRKEHMKAHSPIAAADPVTTAGGMAAAEAAIVEDASRATAGSDDDDEEVAGGNNDAAAAAAATDRSASGRALRAAAVQTSHLHKQLDGANARLSALSEELRSLRTAKEMRDAEVSRLQARAHAKEADPMLSVAHVNEEKNLTIAQLNHQVGAPRPWACAPGWHGSVGACAHGGFLFAAHATPPLPSPPLTRHPPRR